MAEETQDMQMPEELSPREKFEHERLTRRQALKKLGLTTGMSLFALFSVDDLAHMVGRAMEQRAGDSKVANQIAKEFQQAGIALAAGPVGPSRLGGPCTNFQQGDNTQCDACNNERYDYCKKKCPDYQCAGCYNKGSFVCGGSTPTYALLQNAWKNCCGQCLTTCN